MQVRGSHTFGRRERFWIEVREVGSDGVGGVCMNAGGVVLGDLSIPAMLSIPATWLAATLELHVAGWLPRLDDLSAADALGLVKALCVGSAPTASASASTMLSLATAERDHDLAVHLRCFGSSALGPSFDGMFFVIRSVAGDSIDILHDGKRVRVEVARVPTADYVEAITEFSEAFADEVAAARLGGILRDARDRYFGRAHPIASLAPVLELERTEADRLLARFVRAYVEPARQAKTLRLLGAGRRPIDWAERVRREWVLRAPRSGSWFSWLCSAPVEPFCHHWPLESDRAAVEVAVVGPLLRLPVPVPWPGLFSRMDGTRAILVGRDLSRVCVALPRGVTSNARGV